MIWSASSNRLARLSKGSPKASNSGLFQPAPMPNTKRPLLTSYRVTAILAVIAGLRKELHKTMLPNVTRCVASANADKMVQHSQMPVVSPSSER